MLSCKGHARVFPGCSVSTALSPRRQRLWRLGRETPPQGGREQHGVNGYGWRLGRATRFGRLLLSLRPATGPASPLDRKRQRPRPAWTSFRNSSAASSELVLMRRAAPPPPAPDPAPPAARTRGPKPCQRYSSRRTSASTAHPWGSSGVTAHRLLEASRLGAYGSRLNVRRQAKACQDAFIGRQRLRAAVEQARAHRAVRRT